ncbi:MAG: exodeoxyribonuclease VII large subunit [Burkholderiaceae bacterium]|nr:exodeoxyribonuclease VII large subunit [Burkholderiaceae bacterium]
MQKMRLVWSVSALLAAVSDSLQARFAACVVEGELSGFTRATSGHCYFSLKDADGQAGLLRCAMFRRAASLMDFSPRDGQRVELRGRLAVYEPRGELQFVVEGMRRAGAGALYEQFLRLKAQMEAQGWFDAERKQSVPAFASRIGVVTSTAGAALHDVLTALKRRAPHVEVMVYPTPVQGAEAPPGIVQALQTANARAEVDVLLLCRGGGSLEDLWAFNDERVVRAVAASDLPVICGVGHETDVTLADLAADLRAATPTAAAELAAPATAACLAQLDSLAQRMQARTTQALDRAAQQLDRLALRLNRPSQWLSRQRSRLDLLAQRQAQTLPRWQLQQSQGLAHWATRREAALAIQMARQQARLDGLATRLAALDPRQVLARGYAWLDEGRGQALTGVSRMHPGQQLRAVMADGEASLTVDAVRPN